MDKKDSIYSASLTGCGFMVDEMTAILPLFMCENPELELKKEVIENNYLHINSQTTRSRAVSEFKKRYNSLTREFWEHYIELDHKNQVLAMFYVMLKAYPILFDLHFDVTVKKWASVAQIITKGDVLNGIYTIEAKDEFVASWSNLTKNKLSSAFITILKKTGLIKNSKGELQQVPYQNLDFSYYVKNRELWFLEACLLYPYQINELKDKVAL